MGTCKCKVQLLVTLRLLETIRPIVIERVSLEELKRKVISK